MSTERKPQETGPEVNKDPFEDPSLIAEVAGRSVGIPMTELQEYFLKETLDPYLESLHQAIDDTMDPNIGAYPAIWRHHSRMDEHFKKKKDQT